MVKLTAELIVKLSLGVHKKKPEESINQYLNRITHLYLQDKSIDEVDLIPPCKNLSVIYLYDNLLTKIENFDFATQLTHLYLQNNKIQRLENLLSFRKLTKLHIGGNEIRVVEGLENLNDLIELHIENQKLPEGEKLIFEPRTLLTLANKLEVLNISGNNLDSLNEIGSLTNLQQLFASNNKLNDMKELNVLLKCWTKLWKLELSENPMCTKSKYRERIIVLAPQLEVLDGKEINDTSRQFLQNWKASKEIFQKSKQSFTSPTYENSQFRADFNHRHLSSELPRLGNNPNVLPTYIMPEHSKKPQSHKVTTAKKVE